MCQSDDNLTVSLEIIYRINGARHVEYSTAEVGAKPRGERRELDGHVPSSARAHYGLSVCQSLDKVTT